MAKLKAVCHFHVLPFMFLFSFHLSTQLPPSQSQSLLQIRQLLNYPQALASFDNVTDFCDIEYTPSLTIVCYEDNITQLHIVGDVGHPTFQLNTSTGFLFSTFSQFPNLKVLSLVSLGLEGPLPPTVGELFSLEILDLSSNSFHGSIPSELSSLKSLQTLILDYNDFSGNIPTWIGSLPVLTSLSLQNNFFNGSLPDSITHLWSLRVLTLSKNSLSGKVPDLSNLTNMQVLELGDNFLGPQFPKLPKRLSILVLKNNRFRSGVPDEIGFLYGLEKLDISSNKLVGPFLASLLALPSIKYLNIGGNRLTGLLLENISCNSDLTFANLSSNLLTGDLPTCLQQLNSKNGDNIIYAGNCLSNKDQEQHPLNFCRNEALAVSIRPHNLEHRKVHPGVVTFLRIFGGIIAGLIIVALIFLTMRRTYKMGIIKELPSRFMTENSCVTDTAKQLHDAKYISQTMKLGTSLSPYRTFNLDELKEATNNFDVSTLISESVDGQIFRGMFTDGSIVAIRSLALKKRQTPQTYMHQLELISKLRHSHLVSALGHCYEFLPDSLTISRVFIIFEYYPYGTLRSHISGLPGQKLSWAKRISAAIEVVKGIQFLHTGIVPGVYSNNLKVTDILLDQDLRVKISSYNLPIVVENGGMMNSGASSTGTKGKRHASGVNHTDKNDVYDIGVILLEIILGRKITSQNEVHVSRDLLQVSLKTDDIARKSIVDPAVHKGCSDESLKTMMKICLRCLHDMPADRPSVEDILWNLHFAGQVQDPSRDNSLNSQDPPASPSPEMP